MMLSTKVRQAEASRFAWLVVLVLLPGCGSQSIKVPSSYAPYNSKDGSFACEFPEGWESKGGGKNGPVWAKSSSGSALIDVKASPTGSLMSDAMGGSRVADDTLPQFEPVHMIHAEFMEIAAEEFDNYTEIAGSPIVMDCPLGPARLSEFTATTTFGGATHGYRATIIGRDKGITVYCTCSEADWSTAKPVFDKTLASFMRGEAE